MYQLSLLSTLNYLHINYPLCWKVSERFGVLDFLHTSPLKLTPTHTHTHTETYPLTTPGVNPTAQAYVLNYCGQIKQTNFIISISAS